MTRSTLTATRFSLPSGLLARLVRALALSIARRRDRQLLARLDPHLLRDIGLSEDQARAEWEKPFWRS
jgi:uncharacterized protein YjiS (DUF1127 family)